MGWYKVQQLETESGTEHECLPGPPSLWSRGGLSGLFVQDTAGKTVKIPREVILRLVADEWQSKQISRLEGQTTEECLEEMGLADSP